MDIRNLPAGHGLLWFKQAIDLGAKNPRAVFGASLLLIAALYAAVLALAVVLSVLAGAGSATEQAPSMGMLLAVALPLTLAIMLLVPVLLGGLMHVIRETEANRAASARDVFLPLRDARGRRLAWLGVVQLVLAVVGAVLMVAIAGPGYWRDYMQAMEAALQGSVQVAPQPDHAGLLFLVQLAFNYFSYALMLFSIPLMLFSGCSLADALRHALRASVRNVGANLLAGVLFIGALVLAAIVVALVALLAGAIGGLIHPVVGSVLVAVVMLGFAAVVLVLLAGAAYLAWRDTFSGAGPAPTPPPVHGIEV